MIGKTILFIVLVIHSSHGDQIYADDDCVPKVVQGLQVVANGSLFWDFTADEPCELTSYQVDIQGNEGDEYHFTVPPTSNYVDVSFLEVCERWRFTVTAISNGVAGFSHTLTTYVPLPADADLTLSYFRFSFEETDILLEWELTNQTQKDCTLEYRLALEDLDRGTISDVYVEGKSARLDNISPCIPYELRLQAINQAHPTIEGPVRTLNINLAERVQTPPIMTFASSTSTSIDMWFDLQGELNRCPLMHFYVTSDGNFHQAILLNFTTDPGHVHSNIQYLKPNNMYYMEASVENTAGVSPPSRFAVQTLPASNS